ncbi:PucR family transcriptional regulator ligand-binding domain-containing protein, partial [Carnobacterium sp.]|uniref:PucR family transcriptional regulator ligand-binding domain-containing protein n=1 Tax=Carnobacterium sp. TaxID=48221 RepID=UPI0028AFE0AF
MTTLKELIAIPRFSSLKSLTAEHHLDHVVDSIEITETPDVAFYIPKNVFILTTAMIFKDDQEKMIPFIDSLVRVNSAGLGIKAGRFIDKIDQKVLDYANKVGLPIIQVPSTAPLGSLLHQLLSYLWNTKTEQISYALDIQKRFSTLLMNDASTARFIAEFGKMVKTPVILLNPFRKVIAYSKHFHHSSKPAEYFVEQVMQRD